MNRSRAVVELIAAVLLLSGLHGQAADMNVILVDFAKLTREARALHGGNSGPLNYGGLVDLTALHREAGLPFTRLHDCHWPNPDVVDIHAVFPDFGKDPAEPASYEFARTDEYLRAIRDAGSQIVFRLGESIEHTPRKYRVNPPSDFTKWAAVCRGIIRHYNEGWADGFRWNISYWEIWNEPDVRPNMWTGTDEQFISLFEIAAKSIKGSFPGLKVGGPAFGSVGALSGETLEPTPFAARFLAHCRDNQVPLDFFSWHSYSADPTLPPRLGRAIRSLLDEYGFRRTESHLNEWNYLPDNDWSPMMLGGQGLPRERWFARIGGMEGAAFAACVLMNLQEAPVDMANYFTAEIQGFGLFTFDGVPKKTYHAFRAFNTFLQTPLRASIAAPGKGLSIEAGLSRAGDRSAVLLSNLNSERERFLIRLHNLPWNGRSSYETLVVDAERNLEVVESGWVRDGEILCEAAAPRVCLIRIAPAADTK